MSRRPAQHERSELNSEDDYNWSILSIFLYFGWTVGMQTFYVGSE